MFRAINYKVRLFTPCSSYGAEEMTPKSQLCACSFQDSLGKRTGHQSKSESFWIQSDTCGRLKRFEYAACGRENFRISKKIFAEKKFPDTCGHGLNQIAEFVTAPSWKKKSLFLVVNIRRFVCEPQMYTGLLMLKYYRFVLRCRHLM